MVVMLDIRKLRLLHELRIRGTVAAVATALSYSPSSVSQQLAASTYVDEEARRDAIARTQEIDEQARQRMQGGA